MRQCEARGNKYLNRVEEVPWRDIFNRDSQSLEWFDEQKNPLGRKGLIELNVPPEIGTSFIENPENRRSVSDSCSDTMFIRRSGESEPPTMVGFIRATQSNEEIEEAKKELFWILIVGGMFIFILTGLGGFWLLRLYIV